MKSIVQNKIIINNIEFIYIIEYKRIKNIYFRVKDDLKIYISSPKGVSVNYLESLLKNNESAIIKMYSRQINKNIPNDDVYYLGNKLIFKEYNGKPYISNDYIYASSIESAKDYIYSLAYDIFNERLNRIKYDFNNLPNFKLKVRKMTSKWGVCNIRSMSITLNTELIFKDVHFIDYVIVHELTHFFHMNHSASFWREVAKHYPYYKEARRGLNHS